MDNSGEIREGMADHETRILRLENLHTLPDCRTEEEKPIHLKGERAGGTISRRELDEMKGLVLYLQRKLNEHVDTARKKRTDNEYKINI